MPEKCDPQNPRYVLGSRGGYSITLKPNNHVIWTREGIRCRECAVYVDLATMDVFDATGPYALQKIPRCEVVVRQGLHGPNELMPIVENLVPAIQKGDVVTVNDGRIFKSQSCIKGSQQVLIGPDNQAFLGAGLMYGTPITLVPVAPRAVIPFACTSSTNNVTESTHKEITAMTKKSAKKETPKYPDSADLESSSAKLIKIKKQYPKESKFFASVSKAQGIYMDAISGMLPSYEDVSEALLDVITTLQEVKEEGVIGYGTTFRNDFREFRNKYKEWLMNNKATASDKYELPEADLKLLKNIAKAIKYDWKTLASRPENAKKILEEYRKSGTVNGHKVQAFTSVASDKVWIAASPKGGNVSDVSAVKALEKYIEQFGKRGKLKLYEAERSNGMVSFTSGCRMFKGTLPEIIAELKAQAIAQAQQEANIVVAEEKYGNKVAGQIYGDIKAIAKKLKSWKNSMTKEEYAQYEAYQKGVIKHVLAEVLPKLPEEYQTKIKAL